MCVCGGGRGEGGRGERGDEEQCILGEREHEKVGMEGVRRADKRRDGRKREWEETERHLQS